MSTKFQSINPATGEVLKEYQQHSPQQVEKALIAAQKAFDSWRQLSYKERGAILKAAAKKVRGRAEALATLATREMGKPIAQSRTEVEKCAFTLDFYADNGAEQLADQIIETDARKSYVSFQPLG